MKRLFGSIEMINQSSLESLMQPVYVANIIRFSGLYGNDFKTYDIENIYGCNDGFGVWQEPNQSAQFLIYASKFKPRTLMEIGSHNGCWAALMTAYFHRFNSDFNAISIDILPSVKLIVDLPLKFEVCSSDKFKGEKFDLVFIDGGRDYNVVEDHYENVGKYSNLCVFHDINCKYAPDIIKFWNKIKQRKVFKQFIDHPANSNMMGIGILENSIKLFL